jgi:hypothetical protein
MGAHGDVTCETCGKSYYELDDHTCNMDDVKAYVRELHEQIDELQRRIDELKSEAIAEMMAANFHRH